MPKSLEGYQKFSRGDFYIFVVSDYREKCVSRILPAVDFDRISMCRLWADTRSNLHSKRAVCERIAT